MSYSPEWIVVGACVGVVALLTAAPLAMIALGVFLLAGVLALVALAAAILATPYLLVRSVRRRHRRM
jgi:hypothetical protein